MSKAKMATHPDNSADTETQSAISDSFREFLKLNGYYEVVATPHEGVCALMKFAFTTGVVCGITPQSYNKRYCYEMEEEARGGLENLKKGLENPGNNWIKLKGYGLDELNPLWSNAKSNIKQDSECTLQVKKVKNKA